MSSSSESPARVSSTTENTRKTDTPTSKSEPGGIIKHPVQVARRNARERNRVRQVNQGFVTLRNHVPAGSKNKKLSKVETLRQAANYIQYLREVLTSNGESVGAPPAFLQQPPCYPTTSMNFPTYSSAGIPSIGDFMSENLNPGNFYGSPNGLGYGQFTQDYSVEQSTSGIAPYGPNPANLIQDYGIAHQMGFLHQKISPEAGSDPSPSNSSYMSDNSFEMAMSPQEIKYSDARNFVQYS